MANENIFTEKEYLDYDGLIEVFKIIQGGYLAKDNVLELTDEEIEETFCEVHECEKEELFDANGYDYVDMGEAGIWATCNIGANKPEEYGLYFAWGETEGYPDTSGDKKFTWDDYKFGTKDNLTKYNSTDNLTTLELEDDAAHVNMGG